MDKGGRGVPRPKIDLVLVCDPSSSVGQCMQDHKSLCVAVMICVTLVNTQTHSDTAFDQLYY